MSSTGYVVRAVYGIAHVILTENSIPARGVALIIFSIFWTGGSESQGHGLRAPCWPCRVRLSSRPPTTLFCPSWVISQICPNSKILGVKTGVIPPTGILQFNHKLSDKNVYFFLWRHNTFECVICKSQRVEMPKSTYGI